MDFVTYPRAPARITPITSSAASETDKARNLTSGAFAVTCLMTSAPPPPGRWTSSSTTSGLVSRMEVTEEATSSPSATTSHTFPISWRTPARNMAWSSTNATRSSSSGLPSSKLIDATPT